MASCEQVTAALDAARNALQSIDQFRSRVKDLNRKLTTWLHDSKMYPAAPLPQLPGDLQKCLETERSTLAAELVAALDAIDGELVDAVEAQVLPTVRRVELPGITFNSAFAAVRFIIRRFHGQVEAKVKLLDDQEESASRWCRALLQSGVWPAQNISTINLQLRDEWALVSRSEASIATDDDDVVIPLEHRSRLLTKADIARFHYGAKVENPTAYIANKVKNRVMTNPTGSGQSWVVDVREFPAEVRDQMR